MFRPVWPPSRGMGKYLTSSISDLLWVLNLYDVLRFGAHDSVIG
jgi:hypothetical protein